MGEGRAKTGNNLSVREEKKPESISGHKKQRPPKPYAHRIYAPMLEKVHTSTNTPIIFQGCNTRPQTVAVTSTGNL